MSRSNEKTSILCRVNDILVFFSGEKDSDTRQARIKYIYCGKAENIRERLKQHRYNPTTEYDQERNEHIHELIDGTICITYFNYTIISENSHPVTEIKRKPIYLSIFRMRIQDFQDLWSANTIL